MPAADRAGAPFISGVVLAAGGSMRMGRPKQLLPIAGKPMLQRTIDNVCRSSLDEIVIVLGAHAAEITASLSLDEPIDAERLRLVVNDGWARGQSASLACGLAHADSRAQAAAFLLGDQPTLAPDIVDRVCSAFASTDRTRTPFARPVFRSGGRSVPGHPVVAAREVWGELRGLGGDAGARDLLASRPERLLEIVVDEPAPVDLDTPEDYRRLLG